MARKSGREGLAVALIARNPARLEAPGKRFDANDFTMRKVVRRVHGGVLLGPFMCGWTTVVQPSFSRVKRASRRPGRGGVGRRGPRDRRVTAEIVT
mgnify:FL=1